MALCAGLAWHFHEINSVLQFLSAGFATPRVTAGEIIYDILRYLASVTPLKQQPGRSFLDTLVDAPDISRLPNQPDSRNDSHGPLEFLVFYVPFGHLELTYYPGSGEGRRRVHSELVLVLRNLLVCMS